MGMWNKAPRQSWTRAPVDVPQMQEYPGPRAHPHPPFLHYRARRPFSDGAPGFTYDMLALPEYPVVAGFVPNFPGMNVYQPAPPRKRQTAPYSGLGQSANMHPPLPNAEQLYSPSALQALIDAAQQGIGYPPYDSEIVGGGA